MKNERLNEIAKKIGIIILVMFVLGHLFFTFFVVNTPEKAIIWEIFREGEMAYSEARQAEITFVMEREGGFEDLYQSKIVGGEERLWRVIQPYHNWLVIEYSPQQQFNDVKNELKLTRQDVVEACIQKELEEKNSEAELWKKYAFCSDQQIEELYVRLFLRK